MKSAAERIVERIATGLALGLYLPGQKLPPERDLAERMGVSRVTLRAALARLEDLGHVERRRGRYGGTVVASDWSTSSSELVRRVLGPAWERLEHLFDFYAQTSELVARLAAERHRPDDLVRIDGAAARYAAAEDRDEVRDGDRSYHRAIARATRNPLFADTRALRAELTLGTDALPYSEKIHDQARREHLEIREAIADRDGTAAGALARAHFVELVEVPMRALHERAHGGG